VPRLFGLQLVPPIPSSAALVSEVPPSIAPPAEETVYLLTIELPASDRENRLCFSRREQAAWCAEAGARGASLVVLLSDDRIELYSTERDRTSAFRPVLKALAAAARKHPELRRARTVSKSGTLAALHLLRHAAGLEGEALGDPRFVAELHMATATAGASLALGPSLGSLFRASANAHRRIRQETALGDPAADPTLRELERLSAERIVEEELLAWQAQEAEIDRAVAHARSFRAVEVANSGAIVDAEAEHTGIRLNEALSHFGDEAPSAVWIRLSRMPGALSKRPLASSDH
jgi:hypothetical protein